MPEAGAPVLDKLIVLFQQQQMCSSLRISISINTAAISTLTARLWCIFGVKFSREVSSYLGTKLKSLQHSVHETTAGDAVDTTSEDTALSNASIYVA